MQGIYKKDRYEERKKEDVFIETEIMQTITEKQR